MSAWKVVKIGTKLPVIRRVAKGGTQGPRHPPLEGWLGPFRRAKRAEILRAFLLHFYPLGPFGPNYESSSLNEGSQILNEGS